MAYISVIIPVYNCEQYIEEAIESVLAQSFLDWELILVNDGSTDGSRKICASYERKDKRIRLIDKPNGGGGGEARNVGMDYAKSPFIAFLDSDDFYEKDILKVYASEQEKGDYDCVVVGYEDFIEDKKAGRVCYDDSEFKSEPELKTFFTRHFPEGLLGFPWTKLYRKSIIDENKIRFPKMRRLEDGIFNLYFFKHCNTLKVSSYAGINYRDSRQVEKGKLPYDFYDLIEQFTETTAAEIDKWGYPEGESAHPDRGYTDALVDYFQNDFVSCIENILMPVWQYSKQEKMAYIKELREKPLVCRMIERRVDTGRYTRLVIDAYRKKNYVWMRCIIKGKLFMKEHMGKLFYRLKGTVN